MRIKLKKKTFAFLGALLTVAAIATALVIFKPFYKETAFLKQDEFGQYKKHPVDTVVKEPGGPDYYEAICLSNLEPEEEWMSKNRDDYMLYVSQDPDFFNDKWLSLIQRLNDIVPGLEIEVKEFEGHIGIFIIRNQDKWQSLSDREKYNFLVKFNEIIIEEVNEDKTKEHYVSLFYTCHGTRHTWMAYSESTNGKTDKIRFDWEPIW